MGSAVQILLIGVLRREPGAYKYPLSSHYLVPPTCGPYVVLSVCSHGAPPLCLHVLTDVLSCLTCRQGIEEAGVSSFRLQDEDV